MVLWQYILRRLILAVGTLLVISLMAFIIIQLPPGDFLSTQITTLRMRGAQVDQDMIKALEKEYGLDKPLPMQYLWWMWQMMHGKFGVSLEWKRPVLDLIMERLPLTILVSGASLLFVYLLAIPIGVYSAVKQYSVGDYMATVFGFIGMATPNFLLALILMWFMFSTFGVSVGGLFSQEYLTQPMSWGKFVDLLKHLPVPIIVVGMAGTAGLIRVMRGGMLDELRRQYVTTARAKGVAEKKLLTKYPMRVALNPIVSTVGWQLPAIVSGETITSIVLGLPTTGPLLYRSLQSQDMYMAGSIIMFLSALTVIGTLLSDILLAVLDPRIRFEGK
ncbi:MAG: ABC transporter permease [Anaerolineales bacterium]|nr:ABC transporter permease [Anaerolineales bacterium]